MDIYLNKYYITILMAGKKNITKTKKVDETSQPISEQVSEVIEIVIQTPQTTIEATDKKQESNNNYLTQEKFLSKPGRTLLVKSNKPFNLSSFDSLKGLVSKAEINQHNSIFLVFDTIKNSEIAYATLGSDYNVKYSYYKIFFSLSNNIESSNFEKIKQELITYIETNTDSSMLHSKFYRKDTSYMNCGYLVLDTIDGMKKLISKESSLKQFKTESVSGTFYRFNNTKYKTPETSQNATK